MLRKIILKLFNIEDPQKINKIKYYNNNKDSSDRFPKYPKNVPESDEKQKCKICNKKMIISNGVILNGIRNQFGISNDYDVYFYFCSDCSKDLLLIKERR